MVGAGVIGGDGLEKELDHQSAGIRYLTCSEDRQHMHNLVVGGWMASQSVAYVWVRLWSTAVNIRHCERENK